MALAAEQSLRRIHVGLAQHSCRVANLRGLAVSAVQAPQKGVSNCPFSPLLWQQLEPDVIDLSLCLSLSGNRLARNSHFWALVIMLGYEGPILITEHPYTEDKCFTVDLNDRHLHVPDLYRDEHDEDFWTAIAKLSEDQGGCVYIHRREDTHQLYLYVNSISSQAVKPAYDALVAGLCAVPKLATLIRQRMRDDCYNDTAWIHYTSQQGLSEALRMKMVWDQCYRGLNDKPILWSGSSD